MAVVCDDFGGLSECNAGEPVRALLFGSAAVGELVAYGDAQICDGVPGLGVADFGVCAKISDEGYDVVHWVSPCRLMFTE